MLGFDVAKAADLCYESTSVKSCSADTHPIQEFDYEDIRSGTWRLARRLVLGSRGTASSLRWAYGLHSDTDRARRTRTLDEFWDHVTNRH